MKKRLLSLLCLCAAALTGLSLAACAHGAPKAPEAPAAGADTAGPNLSEKATVTVGWMFLGDSKDVKGWPTVPAQAIEEKFNIKLTLKNYDNETLGLDLAAGTLPDIVQVNPNNVDSVLNGKFALALDPYLDTLAQNINRDTFQFRNDMMRKFRSNGDGKLYFYTPQVGVELAENGGIVASPYSVRWNLYKEIGVPAIGSDDDYIDVLKQMKAIYPQTESGLPVYAQGVANDLGLKGWVHRGNVKLGLQQVGADCLYQQDVRTNDIFPNVYNTQENTSYWDSMRYYNRLYQEGLLDPDSFIMKREDMDAKASKGQYVAKQGLNANKDAANYNPLEGEVSITGKFGWYGCDFKLGWIDKLYFVNAKGPQIERSVMVLDYLNSDEFARINFSGIKGEHWDVVDGKPAMKPETIAFASDPARAADWAALEIDFWRFNCMVGQSAFAKLEDGGYASLWENKEIYAERLDALQKDVAQTFHVDYPGEVHRKLMAESDEYFNMSTLRTEIIACLPVAPSKISRIDKACEEAALNAIPKLVTAASGEEFQAAKAELLSALKSLGAEESAAWWSGEWATAKAYVESIL